MADEKDLEQANRAFFDQYASLYDTKPWHQELAVKVTEEIQHLSAFILADFGGTPSQIQARVDTRKLKLLDYACGTGMVTRALGHLCREVVGIDVSSNMLERYQALMSAHNIAGLTFSTVAGNMLTEEEPAANLREKHLYDFDIAAVGFGFHHFGSPTLCIQRLAERLKPGGTILIVDVCVDGDKLPLQRGVKAHGFNEQSMKEAFDSAGLIDFGYHRMPRTFDMAMHEGEMIRKVPFLARATKPL